MSQFPTSLVEAIPCKICGTAAPAFDVIDFNRSCEELRGKILPLSGVPIYYHRCPECDFIFAPVFDAWEKADFIEHIYNDSYVDVDPDYVEARPAGNAQLICQLFGEASREISMVDYGGGNGILAQKLRDAGWNALSYDPFVDSMPMSDLPRADLVTAFEVFEHVPDLEKLIDNLTKLAKGQSSIILFSTQISDGQVPQGRLNWWYAAPRNGHISLFSRKSLSLLLQSRGWNLGSFNLNLHIAFRDIPPWAKHMFPDS